jgi:hypothetical protein
MLLEHIFVMKNIMCFPIYEMYFIFSMYAGGFFKADCL